MSNYVSHVSFRRCRPLQLPLSCEVVENRWFLGPRFVGVGYTADFTHTFSNCTQFRACGQFWLSCVRRARRVAELCMYTRAIMSIRMLWYMYKILVFWHQPLQMTMLSYWAEEKRSRRKLGKIAVKPNSTTRSGGYEHEQDVKSYSLSVSVGRWWAVPSDWVWGALSRGAHPWIDPRFGWTTGALQGFINRSNTSHPRLQWRDMTRCETANCGKCEFFRYFAIVWATDDMKLLQWNIVIDRRWKQTWTDELHRVQSNWKSCFFSWVCTRWCKSIGWHGCGGSVLPVRSTN